MSSMEQRMSILRHKAECYKLSQKRQSEHSNGKFYYYIRFVVVAVKTKTEWRRIICGQVSYSGIQTGQRRVWLSYPPSKETACTQVLCLPAHRRREVDRFIAPRPAELYHRFSSLQTSTCPRLPDKHLTVHTIPGKHLHVHTIPGKHLNVYTIPGKHLNVYTIPGKHLIVNIIPGKHLNVDTIPDKQLNVHTIPGKHLHVHTIPGMRELAAHVVPPGQALYMDRTLK